MIKDSDLNHQISKSNAITTLNSLIFSSPNLSPNCSPRGNEIRRCIRICKSQDQSSIEQHESQHCHYLKQIPKVILEFADDIHALQTGELKNRNDLFCSLSIEYINSYIIDFFN